MSAVAVTLEQQAALIEFLEQHQELALGRFSRTKEGRSLSKRLWFECANILNNVSANCSTRGPVAWRTYFADYKSKLVKRIKKNKQELSATGGGQFSQLALTALQERLFNILRRDVAEPLTGVRHNPLDVTFETNGGDGGEDINKIEAPWDEETPATISTSFSLGHVWPMTMDTSAATLETTTAAMETNTARMATTSSVMVTTTAAMATTPAVMATTTAATVTTSATTVPRRTEPPRRRHRYHHRKYELAEQRLAAIESRRADATFALAKAIERLADALDGHSRRPLQEQSRRRTRRRIYRSSDGE